MNWSELPKNRLESEFMETVNSMSRDERINLANVIIRELAMANESPERKKKG